MHWTHAGRSGKGDEDQRVGPESCCEISDDGPPLQRVLRIRPGSTPRAQVRQRRGLRRKRREAQTDKMRMTVPWSSFLAAADRSVSACSCACGHSICKSGDETVLQSSLSPCRPLRSVKGEQRASDRNCDRRAEVGVVRRRGAAHICRCSEAESMRECRAFAGAATGGPSVADCAKPAAGDERRGTIDTWAEQAWSRLESNRASVTFACREVIRAPVRRL